jgi:hypothetical protein
MKLLNRILAGLFGGEPESKNNARLDKEDLEALAAELSKKELTLSDGDIKRIAHNIVDLDRDADRLAARIIKSRSFWLPLVLGLIVIGIGGFATIWFKISSKVDEQIGNLKTSVQAKLESTYEEVAKNIAARFQEKTFSNIVVSVASNEATNLLLTQIYPVLTNFEDTVSNSFVRIEEFNASLRQSQAAQSNLQAVINEANDAVLRLNQDSDFVIKAILAENDNRAAYEELRRKGNDLSFRHHESAVLVADRVQGSYVNDLRAWALIPWSDAASNRFSWTTEQINNVWNRTGAYQAVDYIRFVWGHTNMTTEQRISFLRNAYLNDSRNSLQAANTAADLVSQQLGVNNNSPFNYSALEKRWLEYSMTNHLFTIPANESSNTVYDIICSPSTNCAIVITNWGETKLVLFKLRYPAVPRSIDAMCLYNATCQVDKMKLGGSYLNTVWAKFTYWDRGVKTELKYERDLSATNVQSISFLTNTLVLDGFPKWEFP